jgi:hypothetical protein
MAPFDVVLLAHHDTDGLVSLALATWWVRWRHPDARPHLETVDFDIGGRWGAVGDILREGKTPGGRPLNPEEIRGVVVSDFPYPGGVASNMPVAWVDHHPAAHDFGLHGAAGVPEAPVGQRRIGDWPVWHDSGASCAARCWEALLQAEGVWEEVPDGLKNAVPFAEKVDQARWSRFDIEHPGEGILAWDILLESLSPREAAGIAWRLSWGEPALLPRHEAVLREAGKTNRERATTLSRQEEWLAPGLRWGMVDRLDRFAKAHAFRETTVDFAALATTRPLIDGIEAVLHLSRAPGRPASLPLDCGAVTRSLGGGGHAFAAMARYRAHSQEEAMVWLGQARQRVVEAHWNAQAIAASS